MVVRLRAALCGVAILCAYSSYGIAKPTNDREHFAAARTTHTRPDRPSKSHVHREDAGQRRGSIVGAASMYNPFEPGPYEGPIKTASGELYDIAAWTAAIQTRFRQTFGGIRYGKEYRPAYALVEAVGKRAIIKINDVGPLEPGRVIDLSKKTMAYFDPSLQKGVIPGVKITPLQGKQWTPGPLES
jgi:peptidoglycan lytic transglycosylase